MEHLDRSQAQPNADFETEALAFLPNVARYARLLAGDRADADDLTQETFLRAFQAWSTFRPGTDCRKWLFTICRNVFLRNRQRSKRFVSDGDAENELRAMRDLYSQALAQGLNDLFDRMDVGPAFERALRELLPEYREAVILIDVEDYSYAEAANVVGVPIGTIRSRLFRARRRLQQSLLEYARDFGFALAHGNAPAHEEVAS
jgi:RNA polymerase sigma-70 factor (ECF subfamily)